MLPATGLLEPGQASQIKVTIQPLMAIIYEAEATCWYGEGSKQKSSIQLQAVGEARPLTCPQSPPAAPPWVSKPQCAPFPTSRPGTRGTSTSLPPSLQPCRLGFFFALFGVTDLCFLGDTCLLQGAVQLGSQRP